MRTRRTYYKDYGMSADCVKWLKSYCTTTTEPIIIRESAEEACTFMLDELYRSLRYGMSYTDVQDEVDYLPCGREDFYGYQRKTLFLLMEKLLEDKKGVNAIFETNGWKRTYYTYEEAAEELQIAVTRVKDVATKAGAITVFGNLERVDINKMRAYILGEDGGA